MNAGVRMALRQLRSLFTPQLGKAMLTSSVVMGSGDVVCQLIQADSLKKSIADRLTAIDTERVSRFGILGLTLHGPYFYHGFRWLDTRYGPSKVFRTALLKTLVGQVTMFPVYLALFFPYMGWLEGANAHTCLEKVKAGWPAAYTAGWIFWPPANLSNFMFVPPAARVLYVNLCGLLWNAFLSYTNSRANRMVQQGLCRICI
eukprot:jgi/Mesvir1/24473/Mv21833-RA.1